METPQKYTKIPEVHEKTPEPPKSTINSFQTASPSAHPPAAAARRAPLAELVFQEVISESTVLSEYYFFSISNFESSVLSDLLFYLFVS